jgi:hypothetical protein
MRLIFVSAICYEVVSLVALPAFWRLESYLRCYAKDGGNY